MEVTAATATMVITPTMLTFPKDACKVLPTCFYVKKIENINISSVLTLSIYYYEADYNPKPKEHCQRSCGNLPILFPFGLEEDCFGNERFRLNCTAANETLFSTRFAQYHVTALSVEDGTLTVSNVLNNASSWKEVIIAQATESGDVYIWTALWKTNLIFLWNMTLLYDGQLQIHLVNKLCMGIEVSMHAAVETVIAKT